MYLSIKDPGEMQEPRRTFQKSQLLNINVISFATVRHYGQLVLRFCNSLNFISAHICKLQVVEGPIKNDEDHYRWILISVLPGNYSKMPRHTRRPLKIRH